MPSSSPEVSFGAFLAYSPRGQSEVSTRSRTITYAIKNDAQEAIRSVVARLKTHLAGPEGQALAGILRPGAVLVPCPRSNPLRAGGLWPALRICQELVQAGLAGEVQPLLERHLPIRRSASAGLGERPLIADHEKTLRIIASPPLGNWKHFVLVDDIITKGATAYAAAALLRACFPETDISVFALVRTLGLQPEIDQILAPCTGVLRQSGGEAVREP